MKMNKTYLILLSSLIACTSRGMDDAEQIPSKVPSLLTLAAKQIANNIDLQVQEDVKILKEHNQLTQENVHERILNRFAMLELSEDSAALHEVITAYRELSIAVAGDVYQQVQEDVRTAEKWDDIVTPDGALKN